MFIIRKTNFQYNDECYTSMEVQKIYAIYNTQKEAYEELVNLEYFEYTNSSIPLYEIEPFNSLNGGLKKEVVDKINEILGGDYFKKDTWNYPDESQSAYNFELNQLNPKILPENVMKIRELTGLHFYDLFEVDEPILYQASVNIKFLKFFNSIKKEKVEVGSKKRDPKSIFEKISALLGKEYTTPVFGEILKVISVEDFYNDTHQLEYPEPVYFTNKNDFSEHDYFLIKVLETNGCNVIAYNDSLTEISNSPSILFEWLKSATYVKHDARRRSIELEFKFDYENRVLDYKTERNRFFEEASAFHAMLKEPPFYFSPSTLKEIMKEKEERETEEYLE
jgi:hypothetical protein